MGNLVCFSVKKNVGFITLNRPEAGNAINLPLARELSHVVDQFAIDSSVKTILITGAGMNFCVGGDIKWFSSLADKLCDGFDEVLRILNPMVLKLHHLPIPVLTAVQGVAAGAGVGLALCGDIILAGQSCQFVSGYSRIGLSPDLGLTFSMTQRIGPSRTKQFLFFNDRIDANQCFAWGMVNNVYPDDQLGERAEKLACKLANGPTLALEYAKRLVDLQSEHKMKDILGLERKFLKLCGKTTDAREGIQSFLEKRNPNFMHK